jgi:DNA-binding transcriptional regulator YdaS (Cro superfamily)
VARDIRDAAGVMFVAPQVAEFTSAFRPVAAARAEAMRLAITGGIGCTDRKTAAKEH